MSQFLSNLPIGAKVKFGKYSVNGETAEPITWLVVAKNHSCTPAYPSNSVTLLTEGIIDIRALDAKEPTNVNFPSRQERGNNRYTLSNLDQWLNKRESLWYSPTHIYDSSPTNDRTGGFGTGYDTRPGFLNAFSNEEFGAILDTTIRAVLADVDGGGQEDVSRKVFVPSGTEAGYITSIQGNTTWEYFINHNMLASLTKQAYTHSLCTQKPNLGESHYWWIRDVNTGDGANGRTAIGERGTSYWVASTGSAGVRPALNVSNSLSVTDTVDGEGCYSVVWNEAPVIDGKDENIGIKSTSFGGNYTITDANNDIVTVTEAIDGIRIRTLVATLGERIYYDVTDNTWLALPNGSHTLTISATDGIDTTVRTIVFTKLVDTFKIQNTTPWVSSTMPSRIMLVITRNIPPAATFKVEVCNNGYDSSPTWEDCSDAVASGMAYMFTNKTKTATDWGVLVRVTVARNGAAGACYVSSIGGNFE